jgi:3-mercaptopyruvate sulfurtransferase SseA
VALLLRKQGIKRIRPLQGGLDGWREAGYALQAIASDELKQNSMFTQIKA